MKFNDTLEAAQFYAANGFPVLPIKPEDKLPATRKGVKDATTNRQQIREWFDNKTDYNLAVATGDQAGVAVLDIDPRNGGDITLRDMIDNYIGRGKKLPETPTTKTGGGGLHYWFKQPLTDTLRNRSIGPGVDIKTEGGYVIVPPSFTDDYYSWVDGRGLDEVKSGFAQMPGWMIEKASSGAQNFTFDEEGKVGPGQRNNFLTSIAGTMRRRGLLPDTIKAALESENAKRCDPPIPQGEIDHIADSVSKYEPEDPALKEHDDDLDIDVRMDAEKSERIILGYIVGEHDNDEALNLNHILSSLDSDQFIDKSHQKIFRAIKAIFSEGVKIDKDNIRIELESVGDWGKGKIDKQYLAQLSDEGNRIVYPSDVQFNTKKIQNAHMLREASRIYSQGSQQAQQGKEDPQDLVRHTSDRLMKLLDQNSQSQVAHTTEAIDQVRDLLDKAKRGELAMNEPTGWDALDDKILGLPKGEVSIIAGRPAQGKTAASLQLACQMAKRWHHDDEPGSALFFSAEMTAQQLMMRNVSREAEMDSFRIRKWKDITDEEEGIIENAMTRLEEEVNMYVDETPSPSPQYMLAKAMAINNKEPIRLVVMDFLELVGEDSGNGHYSKVVRLEEALKKLKVIAKTLNCPVVVLSQLSRKVESRANEENEPIPRMSDLRWTGMAEQIANVILMMYYPWGFYNNGIPFAEEPDIGHYEMHVNKNRDGKVGVVDFEFVKHFGYLRDLGISNEHEPSERELESNEISQDELPFGS